MAVPILMYHQIATRADASSRLAVPPSAFADQLAYLRAEGFVALSASALAAALRPGGGPAGGNRPDGLERDQSGGARGGERGVPGRAVVLTFDDGYADFHRTALPLLNAYGFTATVFVTTGWIADAGPRALPPTNAPPGPMLSWSQIKEAAEAGVEIGAHSHSHPQLDQLDRAGLLREIESSKALLEDQLGRTVPGVAYPFGYSNARVRRAAATAGHRYACAVGNVICGSGGATVDLFALPRLTIRRSTGLQAFDRIARGRPPLIYLKDRSLTKGWALVRRTRASLGAL
jgi:peptidoglycan/xylan/chitin deacetylase (PgdA/CDA1 family)